MGRECCGWAGGRAPARAPRPAGSCSHLYLLLNLGPDIGHVDFLEKVYGLAERPYVIAGLHFDQVSPPGS